VATRTMTYTKARAACASRASGLRALPSDTKRVMKRMGSAGKRTCVSFVVKCALQCSTSQRKPPQSPAPPDAPEDKADAVPEADEQPIAPTADSSNNATEERDASIEVSRTYLTPTQAGFHDDDDYAGLTSTWT
jgi:hypothetical protein